MHAGTSKRVRHLIAIVALIAGFASAGVWLVNRPETLAHALAIANLRSTFQVALRSFHWSPQRSAIELSGLTMEQPSTGKRLDVGRIRVHYRLLGLLRGKAVIDSVELDDVRMALPPQPKRPKEEKARRRIDVARLLLIKNLEVHDAAVNGFSLAFGKGMRLDADELHLALIPSLFGEGRISISTGGVRLLKGDREVVASGLFSLKSSTELERWTPEFPYLNAFHGKLVVQDATAAGLSIERFAAEVRKEDDVVDLEGLRVSVSGRELRGALSAALDTQEFTGAIDIPEPIRLPYIGKPLTTIDAAGEVSAAIRFDGKGFDPAESAGAGHVDLVYRFDLEPQTPVAIATDVVWSAGAIVLSDAKAAAGPIAIALGGTIDIRGKQIDLFASGRDFPLEDVFLIFKNPHLAKIFGPTDFEGTFKGWGKQFEARVRGITEIGGWKPIAAERVVSELTATYDSLSLKGTILSGNRETGKADLFIRYGPRGSDGTRAKDITLDASIAEMPVDLPLGAYALAGIGSGSIRIRGPHTAFTGRAEATVVRGAFHGIPFERASATMDLTRHRLTFGDFRLQLPKAAEAELGGTLIGDIDDGTFRMHGEPVRGLTVDATYLSAGSRWNVASLRWNDPATGSDLVATGSYVSGGGTDLRVRGRLDAAVLPRLLTTKLRDARGPVDVDVALRGPAGAIQPAGTVAFRGTALRLRSPQIAISELNGALMLSGDRIACEKLTAEMDDGSFTLSGSLAHRQFAPYSADLAMSAETMRYRTEDRGLNLEMDAELKLTGAFPSPLLSGDITILDGKYTKDFNLIELISGSGERERAIRQQETPPEFNPRLALRLRNSGDLAIRNNVGDIWLNTNVEIGGTRAKPHVSGAIDVSSGEVHYLGIRFDINRGFMEFRGRADEPYLEVYASKEINVYNVNLVLHGTTDNLQLDLSATSPSGPLEKRDVVSLILFGTTEQDRIAAGQRAGSQFSTSMVAQSLTGFVSGPVSRFAGLDEFRLEASDPGSTGISRISAGKKVSDRLTVKFATDISKSSSVQTFAAEYLITDNLLIKGSQSTDATSEFSGILRFRLR